MMTLSRSMVRMRSRITRYWFIGVSSESKCFAHSPSHAFFTEAISSLSEASALPPRAAPFCFSTSAISASITSAASPTTESAARHSLLMSLGSLVEWITVLPGGMLGPKFVLVTLEPIAITTSALAMNSVNIFERERVEPPSASGCASGIALLPGLVATTGAGMSSASAASRSPASA